MIDDASIEEYTVVMNGEEQYSIWPAYKQIPNGWRAVGVKGDKSTCLEYIDRVWIDLRPKSLRERQTVYSQPDSDDPDHSKTGI